MFEIQKIFKTFYFFLYQGEQNFLRKFMTEKIPSHFALFVSY